MQEIHNTDGAVAETEVDPTQVFEKIELYETWDEDYYQPIALRLYDRAVGDMLDLLTIEPGALVLDAGCGPGVHSIRAAQQGYKVRALDVSQAVLDEASQRAQRAGVPDEIEFSCENLTQLSLPDEKFKSVFCWGVVIHIPDIGAALDELARIVAPGGKLALQVTNRDALDHKIENFARALLRRPLVGSQNLDFGRGCSHEMDGGELWVWHLDLDAVKVHLERKGFVLKERRAVEFTHLQRRVPGPFRKLLLHINNWWYGAGLSAGLAATNMLVFEKTKQG